MSGSLTLAFGCALLGIVCTSAGFGQAISRAEIEKKQDQSMYDPQRAGMKDYVLELRYSEWQKDATLRDAALQLDSKSYRFEAKGVPAAQHDAALTRMLKDYADLQRVREWSAPRVEMLPEGYTVECSLEQGWRHKVVATRNEVQHPPKRGEIRKYELALDEKGVILYVLLDLYEADAIVCDKYSYDQKDGKQLTTFYCFRSGAAGPDGTAKLHYEQVGGYWLPDRIEVTSSRIDREPTTAYTLRYLSINGSPVTSAGAEGTWTAAAEEGPFATAEATVRSFFKAAEKKDRGMLAKCFSPTAPEEFQGIVKQTLSDAELEDLKSSFGQGKITGSDPQPGGAEVTVHIQYLRNSRPATEHLSVVREGDEWKIRDF